MGFICYLNCLVQRKVANDFERHFVVTTAQKTGISIPEAMPEKISPMPFHPFKYCSKCCGYNKQTNSCLKEFMDFK